MESQRILLASDHAGLELKNHLVDFLKSKNLNVVDLGVHDKKRVNYTDSSRKML